MRVRVLFFIVNSGSAESHSPPRRGGVAAPLRKCREATEPAQTGWSDRQALDFAELTTPALSRLPSSARRGMRPRNFQTQH